MAVRTDTRGPRVTNEQWTLWQRWTGSKGTVPGGWKFVHRGTAREVERAASGLRDYGREHAVEGHEVKVTGPGELP